MTEKEMRIYKAVFEARTLTQAAAQLYLTQSYVTRTIQKIEADFGTVLFNRNHKHLSPSPEGELFYVKVCTVLDQITSLENLFREESDSPSISILATPYLAEVTLSETLFPILNQYPDLVPDIRVYSSRLFRDLLQNKPADIVLSSSQIELPEYIEVDSFNENLGLLAAKDSFFPDQISLQELASHRLLLRESSSSLRQSINSLFSRIDRMPQVFAESASSIVLLQMAQAGLGIAVVPYMLSKTSADFVGLRLLNPSDFSLSRRIYIYIRNKSQDKTYVSLYLGRLLTYLHQNPRKSK